MGEMRKKEIRENGVARKIQRKERKRGEFF